MHSSHGSQTKVAAKQADDHDHEFQNYDGVVKHPDALEHFK